VVGKDVNKNILYVAQEKGNDYRLSSRCLIDGFNWIGNDIPTSSYDCNCKFRYRGKDMPVKLTIIDNHSAYLSYDNYSYVAKGQIACLYEGSRLVGSGIIEKTYDKNYKEINY
jgi:tRNA-specific 2-thiouridylase